MADKKLLEESTIRRFMELANIKPSEKGMLSEARLPHTGRSPHAGMTKKDQSGPLESIGVRSAQMAEKKANKKSMHQEDLEETVDEELEEGYGSDMHEADEEGDAMGGMDAGGMTDATGEGGDIKSAFQKALDAFNELAQSIPELQGSEVVVEPEGDESDDMAGESDEEESDDMGSKEAGMMEANDKMEEELEESIELVDDTLVEKLLQRVSARLVAEARKSRELAESKTGWGKQGMKKAKKPSGKGAGKGTPFTHSVSVKGTAGRK